MSGVEGLKIRRSVPEDLNHILSTWLKNYRKESQFAERIRTSIFFAFHEPIVKHILNREGSCVLVAHHGNDEDIILGYLVYEARETPVIHFVYTKPDFRRMGIARALIDQAAVDLNQSVFTHWTYSVDLLNLKEKFPGLDYVPYQI